MKIIFVLPGIGFSGGIRTVFECSNRLIQRGHKVKIVYPLGILRVRKKRSVRDYFEFAAIILRRWLVGKRVGWFNLKADLIRIPFLWKGFSRYLPDADAVVATALETAEFVSQLEERCGKKLFFVQHYEAWDLWNNEECWEKISEKHKDLKKGSLEIARMPLDDDVLGKYRGKINSIYKLQLKVFTTSSWLRDLLENVLRVKVIGRAEIGNSLTIHKKIIKSEGTILMPLRGSRWRGDDDGITALELVRKDMPEVKVNIFGASYHRHEAPTWARYHADLSDEELAELYALADVFILPSWVEGWCSPPMEAMACGTACVCTDVGAVSDYAVDGQTALIVPPRDPEALALACLRLLRDGQQREAIARAGREYIKKFTWERTADQMEEIFNAALKLKDV